MNKTQGKLCRSLLSPSNNCIGWYWLILGGTRSVWSGTGWYLWYWVSRRQYWLIYDGTGSVEGGNGWYSVVLGQ